MEWPSLLSFDRLLEDRQQEYDRSRPPWQIDYDRIVFSSAFRRLQDKTQVFPLSGSDYVRTRLTHSLEVSTVARTLGTLAGDHILKTYGHLSYGESGNTLGEVLTPADLGMICAAGALAHDIGNPPFGHSGEDAIRHWFVTSDVAATYAAKLTDPQKKDFEQWEGNAEAFRIVARSQVYRGSGGMRMTAATLGAFAKYPTAASAVITDKTTPYHTRAKKPGFFAEDQSLWEEVASILGLPKDPDEDRWARHPLCYLTEAADDICYRVNDFEDGYKMRCIAFETANERFQALIGADLTERLKEFGDSEAEVISYLRARSIRTLVEQVSAKFTAEESNILAGAFQGDLLSVIEAKPHLDAMKADTKEHVYTHQGVLETEAAGFEIIAGLLDIFASATSEMRGWNDEKDDKESAQKRKYKAEKICQLIPTEFQEGEDHYSCLLQVVDFVAGMTDSFALNLFRKLKGVTIPR